MLQKELQTKKEGQQEAQGADDEVIYRIDIPANRYDMLCLEGIARALNVFQGKQKPVQYKLANMAGKEPRMSTLGRNFSSGSFEGSVVLQSSGGSIGSTCSATVSFQATAVNKASSVSLRQGGS